MQVEFNPSSREKYLAIYDPAALPPDFPLDPDLQAQEPVPPSKQAIQSIAADGCAFIIHVPQGDCELHVRVFIDEPVPEQIIQRSRDKSTALTAVLNVPSGNLFSDGIEFMTFPGQSRLEGGSERVQVPMGLYRLEAYDLLEWKQKNKEREFKERTSATGRFFNHLNNIAAWVGIVLLVANILVAPGVILFVWKVYSWSAALKAGLAIAVLDAVVLTFFHLLAYFSKRFPSLQQGDNVRQAFELENPDLVILLVKDSGGPATSSNPALLKIRV